MNKLLGLIILLSICIQYASCLDKTYRCSVKTVSTYTKLEPLDKFTPKGHKQLTAICNFFSKDPEEYDRCIHNKDNLDSFAAHAVQECTSNVIRVDPDTGISELITMTACMDPETSHDCYADGKQIRTPGILSSPMLSIILCCCIFTLLFIMAYIQGQIPKN